MKEKAIVITGGLLGEADAKTAHGLIRGTDRFEIAGIVDDRFAGRDAGEVLDGRHRDIPVFGDVQEAVGLVQQIRYCIIGVATVGGIMPPGIREQLGQCIRHGISIINGLHDYLEEMDELVALAASHQVELIDIRKPKKRKDLHFWTSSIFGVRAPVIAVLGMDCAMGKRTTCRMVMEACRSRGLAAEMIYTGQTGWLQGGRYGFIFDTTLNDFISGEIEHAIVTCYQETSPDIILLEGQSSLRNPSGPCGSELLVSGNARFTILIHAPARRYYDHMEAWGAIPSVESEIALINQYGSQVIALALNTEHCSLQEALDHQRHFQELLKIPVLLPLEEGVAELVPLIETIINQSRHED